MHGDVGSASSHGDGDQEHFEGDGFLTSSPSSLAVTITVGSASAEAEHIMGSTWIQNKNDKIIHYLTYHHMCLSPTDERRCYIGHLADNAGPCCNVPFLGWFEVLVLVSVCVVLFLAL